MSARYGYSAGYAGQGQQPQQQQPYQSPQQQQQPASYQQGAYAQPQAHNPGSAHDYGSSRAAAGQYAQVPMDVSRPAAGAHGSGDGYPQASQAGYSQAGQAASYPGGSWGDKQQLPSQYVQPQQAAGQATARAYSAAATQPAATPAAASYPTTAAALPSSYSTAAGPGSATALPTSYSVPSQRQPSGGAAAGYGAAPAQQYGQQPAGYSAAGAGQPRPGSAVPAAQAAQTPTAQVGAGGYGSYGSAAGSGYGGSGGAGGTPGGYGSGATAGAGSAYGAAGGGAAGGYGSAASTPRDYAGADTSGGYGRSTGAAGAGAAGYAASPAGGGYGQEQSRWGAAAAEQPAAGGAQQGQYGATGTGGTNGAQYGGAGGTGYAPGYTIPVKSKEAAARPEPSPRPGSRFSTPVSRPVAATAMDYTTGGGYGEAPAPYQAAAAAPGPTAGSYGGHPAAASGAYGREAPGGYSGGAAAAAYGSYDTGQGKDYNNAGGYGGEYGGGGGYGGSSAGAYGGAGDYAGSGGGGGDYGRGGYGSADNGGGRAGAGYSTPAGGWQAGGGGGGGGGGRTSHYSARDTGASAGGRGGASDSHRDESRGRGYSRSMASNDDRPAREPAGRRTADKPSASVLGRRRSRSRSPARPSTAAGTGGAGTKATDSPARPKAPEYAVRVPPFSFATELRDYPEVVKRYGRLNLPPDFSRVVVKWPHLPGFFNHDALDSLGLCTIATDRPARFEHELSAADPEPGESDVLSKRVAEAAPKHADGGRYAVRVLLLQGITAWEREAIARGPHHEGGTHLVHALKFVTARFIDSTHKRGILGALGGMWDPTQDGGDPSSSDEPLRAAAIRHARQQAGIDLSVCRHWYRVCDIHYLHTTQTPQQDVPQDTPMHVAMFCVAADDLLPGLVAWPAMHTEVLAWRAAKHAKEEADKGKAVGKDASKEPAVKEEPTPTPAGGVPPPPADSKPVSLLPEPFIHIKGQNNKRFKIRTASTSLHSLLDYDEEDEDEATFELCVFAEAFHELLMRDYAGLIMWELSGGRYPLPPTSQTVPVLKTEAQEEEAKPVVASSPVAKKAKLEDGSTAGKRRTNMPLLMAFRYFDRTGCGYIKSDDLRRALHNIGTGLPHRLVKQLVNTVIDKKTERLQYRSLTDKGGKDGGRSPSPGPDGAPPPPPPPPPKAVPPAPSSAAATTIKTETSENAAQQQAPPAVATAAAGAPTASTDALPAATTAAADSMPAPEQSVEAAAVPAAAATSAAVEPTAAEPTAAAAGEPTGLEREVAATPSEADALMADVGAAAAEVVEADQAAAAMDTAPAVVVGEQGGQFSEAAGGEATQVAVEATGASAE